jgi:tRNA dimethylallyltransferase
LNFRDRADLRARLAARVDGMMEAGLEAEVKRLLARKPPAGRTAMQAIGYKELAACLTGGLPVEEGVREIKLRSGQYAKRQISWFRRRPDTHWIFWEENTDFSRVLQDSRTFLLAKGVG